MASRPASRWVMKHAWSAPGRAVHQIGHRGRPRWSCRGARPVRRGSAPETRPATRTGDPDPLPLAAGKPGSVLADAGCRARPAARSTQSSEPGPLQGATQIVPRWRRGGPGCRFSRSVVSKMWVSWAARPTTRRTSSPASEASSMPSRVTEPSRRGGTAAGRRPGSIYRPRSGRRCRPGARGQVEVDAVQQPTAGRARIGRRTSRSRRW